MDLREVAQDPALYRCQCPVAVRFRDLDAMAHVNNALYFTYFEMARTAYVEALGLKYQGGSFGDFFPFILGEIGCRYLSAARITDELVVHVRVVRMGKKSFEFEYLVTANNDGRNVAVGRSLQVAFDYDAQKTLALPERFVRMIEKLEGRTFHG